MKPTISLFWSQIDSERPTAVYIQARYGSGAPVAQMRLEVDDQAGWIGAVFVHEAYRRRGLASLLVQRACCICRAHGFESVGLTVHHDNSQAQRLYRQLGFVGYTNGHEHYQQFVKVLTQ